MRRILAIAALVAFSSGFAQADSYNQSSAKALAQQLEGKTTGTRVEARLPAMTAVRTDTGANVRATNGSTSTLRRWTEASNTWESTTHFKKSERVANSKGVTWTFREKTADGGTVIMVYHQRRRGKGESKRQGTLESMKLQSVRVLGSGGYADLEVAGTHRSTSEADRLAVSKLAKRLRAAKPEKQAALATQLASNVQRMTSISSRVGQLGRSAVKSATTGLARKALSRVMGRRGRH
jgi:hypothetical protein